jgi:hypothetical protein
MRKLALFGLMMIFALSACKKGEEAGTDDQAEGQEAVEAPKAAQADPLYGGFDPGAELKALEGTWEVKDSFSEKSTWEITGDKVKRISGDKVEEGTLEISYPGKLAFVQKKGGGTEKSYYGYTRNGDDVYIGLGKAGVKQGDSYLLAVDGLLVMKGAAPGGTAKTAACKYYERDMFKDGFKPDGVEVKCELKQEGDKQVLAYQTPDRFKKGEMREGRVNVLGRALVDDQMAGNLATRVK